MVGSRKGLMLADLASFLGAVYHVREKVGEKSKGAKEANADILLTSLFIEGPEEYTGPKEPGGMSDSVISSREINLDTRIWTCLSQ